MAWKDKLIIEKDEEAESFNESAKGVKYLDKEELSIWGLLKKGNLNKEDPLTEGV